MKRTGEEDTPHKHAAHSADWLLNRFVPAASGIVVIALGAALAANYIHMLRTGRVLFDWLQ